MLYSSFSPSSIFQDGGTSSWMQYPSTSYTGQIVLSQPSSETDSQVSHANMLNRGVLLFKETLI